MKRDIVACSRCHSVDVQRVEWVFANTGVVASAEPSSDDAYCGRCVGLDLVGVAEIDYDSFNAGRPLSLSQARALGDLWLANGGLEYLENTFGSGEDGA